MADSIKPNEPVTRRDVQDSHVAKEAVESVEVVVYGATARDAAAPLHAVIVACFITIGHAGATHLTLRVFEEVIL